MAEKPRKKRIPLTKQKVLEGALAVADAGGLDALTMRNLAQAMGVEAMSLYNHVSNKEDLLDGLVELVAGEFFVPEPGGDWRSAMRRRAQVAHAVLMRHPWATMLVVSRLNVGPTMLRYVDASIGCLVAAGFPYVLADHAWTALDAYTYGFTLQKLNFPLQPGEYAAAAAGFLPLIPKERFPSLHGMSLAIIEGRHDGLHDLEFGLEILLDGLERRRVAAVNLARDP